MAAPAQVFILETAKIIKIVVETLFNGVFRAEFALHEGIENTGLQFLAFNQHAVGIEDLSKIVIKQGAGGVGQGAQLFSQPAEGVGNHLVLEFAGMLVQPGCGRSFFLVETRPAETHARRDGPSFQDFFTNPLSTDL